MRGKLRTVFTAEGAENAENGVTSGTAWQRGKSTAFLRVLRTLCGESLLFESKVIRPAVMVPVIFAAGAFGARAQEEGITELEELVVTATKSERLKIDVPVRTEIISAEDIEARGATNLYEALEGFPGIRVEQQCSYCNFTTVRMQGLESGHVQVLIDGQPIYSGLAGVYGLQQVPAASIERIEVVKGAGSALYGSSAIAGVINIITRRPGREPMTEVTTSFGTDNTNTYTLASSMAQGNSDVMLTVQNNVGDAIDENGDGLTDRVETGSFSAGVRMNWYDIAGGRLTFTGRILDELRAGGDLATWRNPFAEAAESITTRRYEAGIGYKKEFPAGNGLSVNLAYCTHHRSATNDTFLGDYMETHAGAVPPVDEMEPYLADENLYVLDVGYTHPIGGKRRLLMGVQYTREKLAETGKYVIVDLGDPDYGETYRSESEKSADEVGLYFQDEISLTDEVELVFGGRVDFHSSEDGFAGSGDAAPPDGIALEYDESAFNPRFALKYKASDRLALRVSAGTGFRIPYGFSEDLHLCSGSPRVYKGADLKAEESVSFNLSADYTANRYLMSANVFRTDLADKIGFSDASPAAQAMGYDYEWENVGDAYTQGIELGTKMNLTRDLYLGITLTYTDARYDDPRDDWVGHPVHGDRYKEDSKYIPRVPEWTAGIDLSYGPGDWRLTLGCRVTGSMYIDYCANDDIEDPASRIVHTDPFAVVNLKVSKRLGRNRLFFGAKNLFDYVQPEKHPDDAAFMYAPYAGRMIYGGMEMNF